jgi:transposase InsO family protein
MAQKRAIMQLLDATLQVGAASITNVSAWCRLNGVDRRTFYRHRARILAEGSWQERSRRPVSCPGATAAAVVEAVLWVRGELSAATGPGWGIDNGADPIRDRLVEVAVAQGWAARGWRVPSRATINRILSRAGLLTRCPRKRPKRSYRRFCFAQPRDCYQIDGTQVRLAGGEKAVVIEVLDDCTRMLVATRAAASETTAAAVEAINAAARDFGAPAIMLADNGAAFSNTSRRPDAAPTRFGRTVTGWGTRLIHSSPYHPQTCGKVERHHQTFKKWLAQQPTPPATLQALQDLLDTYQIYYNTVRRHSAIGRRTPRQAWDEAADAGRVGGPTNLPMQTDATLHTCTVDRDGAVRIGRRLKIRVGRPYAGTRISIIRDGLTATAYTNQGHPMGYIHLDNTKTYQGKLTPAA